MQRMILASVKLGRIPWNAFIQRWEQEVSLVEKASTLFLAFFKRTVCVNTAKILRSFFDDL